MPIACRLALLAAVLVLRCAAGGEEPAKVTVFELTGGGKIEALRYSAIGSASLKVYVVTALDGRKLTLLEKDLATRSEEMRPLEQFPEAARQEILKARAAAAVARAAAEARSAAQQAVAAAKRAENLALAAFNQVQSAINAAAGLLAKGQALARNTAADLAKADARYDAAKTELSSLHDPYGSPMPYHYYGWRSRADYLRALMERTAQDKTALEIEKRETEAVMARTREALKQLDERLAAAQRALDAAKAETRKAILRLKGEGEQPAAPKPSELLIRAAPGADGLQPQPVPK